MRGGGTMVLRRAAAAAAWCGIVSGSALSHPPPAPPPDLVASVNTASCGSTSPAAKIEEIPVTVSPLPPQVIVESHPTVTWRWGYHLGTDDSRIGGVTGLMVDAKYGTIAMTADRHWLILDDRTDGGFGAVKAIGRAAMRGAPGRPNAIASTADWQLVSFPAQNTVLRYALAKCGVAATGIAAITITGAPSVTAMTEADYSYVGLVGQDASGLKDKLVLPYAPQAVRLKQTNIPALPGYRLVALANGPRIVPIILALWAAPEREAVLQQITVAGWSEFLGMKQTPPVEIAHFKRTPTGITAVYDDKTESTLVLASFDSGNGVDIIAFTIKS